MSLIGLPRPGGMHRVGVSELRLAPDSSAVSVWYPAEAHALGKRARYRDAERGAGARARLLRALVRTNARADVVALPGAHPLLLYLSSWGGTRGENSALAEALAGRGFVVAALDDTDPERPLDFSSPAALADTQGRAAEKAHRAAARSSRALTALLHQSPAAFSVAVGLRVNADRIGVLGFSFGGAVAAQIACDDRRVRAAANLDGWMFGDAATGGVRKPFIVLATGDPELDAPPERDARPDPAYAPSLTARFDAENERRICSGIERHGGYLVALDGARHLSFSDAALLPSARPRAVGGPLGGRRAHRIIVTYLAQFFEHYVGGRAAPLFTPPFAPSRDFRRTEFDPAIRRNVWLAPRETNEEPGSRAPIQPSN